MELIAYRQFAKLRLEGFFPVSRIQKVGPSVECALGLGGGQSVGFTAVFWPDASPEIVGELQLDMRPDECPLGIAKQIIQAVKLPIGPGDSEQQVQRLLGAPEYTEPFYGKERFCRFLVGVKHPYFVGCHIHKTAGLNGLMVVREDFWPKAAA